MLYNEAKELLVEGYEAIHDEKAIWKIFHVSKYTVYHLEKNVIGGQAALNCEHGGRTVGRLQLVIAIYERKT